VVGWRGSIAGETRVHFRGSSSLTSRQRRSISTRAGIVMDLLRKLAVEQHAAIIAVTHDDKIFDRFDRIHMLRDGMLVETRERKAA
jgi:predicted ABC-type transport system involved in lysophospholipase L1 biosynthesis ATPase subunit